jgi:hypothetical protein
MVPGPQRVKEKMPWRGVTRDHIPFSIESDFVISRFAGSPKNGCVPDLR